jgi:hypothetical protein
LKTQQVINNEKRMVSLNIDRSLWKKVKHAAAEKEVTQTAMIEHLIRIDLDSCKHDKIK